MMASFLPVYSEQKERTNKEKYVFYCSVDLGLGLSQVHINPEKHEKNTKMTSSDVPRLEKRVYKIL